jgi:hydroxymethylglutaryl-CoA lyase
MGKFSMNSIVMKLPDRIRIREVAPRDGFQSVSRFISTEHKLQLIRSLLDAGVKELETTSFVSHEAVPQLRDASELMAQVPREGTVHTALIANLRGAVDAVAAGVSGLVVVISASEAHNHANVRRSIDDSLRDLDGIFGHAHANNVFVNGAIAVSFGCPYQGDVPAGDVFRLADEFIRRKASSIVFADTTGMATPKRVDSLVREFRQMHPQQQYSLHFHNNRGTAMANLLAALLAGATVFDTALGGIGGCPNVPLAAGNLATEDVVFMLEDMGIRTDLNLRKLISAARMLEKILGFILPGQVMKSGPRAPDAQSMGCRP